MDVLLLSFLTAFTLTYFAIPSIISIARQKQLYDEPVARSSHKESTPSLGGIAIFAGAVFSIILWTPFNVFSNLQYVLCAMIIIFLIGAKDDISPVSPDKKLVGQLLAAAILVFKSDIRLDSLYGFLWSNEALPAWLSIPLSLFTILVIINAFNLIDGIDGLAGSVGALIAGVLGCWFYQAGATEFATLSFALLGAVLAFLRYNYSPAKIFMGDTGSLILGLVSAVLVITFIDMNQTLPPGSAFRFEGAPAVAVGILIIPLYDTIRVFVTRILRGHSPFHADRRHIHHLLIDFGFSHLQATAALVGVNMLFVTLAFGLHDRIGVHQLLILEIVLASVFTYFLHGSVMRKRRQQEPVSS
jgi:UDP-GlcNAc:undecaprenyl-phosphate/decaprenyl-phosphate GlcNAc-1-phosphate transferase